MPSLLSTIIKFLLSSFGFTVQAVQEHERIKGLEAHNAILQAEIDRDNSTNSIFKKTVTLDEEKLPSFNYDSL